MRKLDVATRRTFVESDDKNFSQRKQCQLLGISRSGLYYEPRPVPEATLSLMRAIDEEYLEHPYYGRRRMAVVLNAKGFVVGQKKVKAAMKMMGLEPIYPKPNLSKANKEHKKFPYLLKGLVIDQPNLVWAADITYIPLSKGFGYLFAIIDWFSRYVIEWELSNLLEADFCIEALSRSLLRRTPEIFNTDQGAQFTSQGFVEQLEAKDIRISMDGKGRALDNVFVERLWRSVKYEGIYPKDYENLKDLRKGLTEYFMFYNQSRPHQGLGYKTPAEVYISR